MAIVAGDIATYLSGGASNSDPDASLGGAKSSTAWTGGTLHDLFDVVTGAENAASEAEYRLVYVQNNHATLTALGMTVHISAETAGGAALAIALAGEGASAQAETIANENTAPSGETFSSPTTSGTGLSIGDLAPAAYYGLWIRRTAANTGAVADDGATLTFTFDTEA